MSTLSDKIKSDLPLTDLIRHYLGESGAAKKWGCPFHSDKTPSLSVKGDHWRCFSCNESGDAIDFVMLLNGVDFKGAIRTISRDFGYSDTTMTQSDKNAYNERKQARKRDAKRIEALKQIEREKIQEFCDKRRVLYYLKRGRWLRWSEIMVIVRLQNEIKLLGLELDEMVNNFYHERR